jgi:hypothetical protein
MIDEQSRRQGDEAALREMAREAMQRGLLPNRRPDRSWGGRGNGADCTVCRSPVTKDELEFELEFARNEDPGQDTYHIHVRCFRAWEFERDSARPPAAMLSRRPTEEPPAAS